MARRRKISPIAALKKMKKLCWTSPKAHLARVLPGEQHDPERDGDRPDGAGRGRAEEDHRQVAQHGRGPDLDAEEPQRERVDHDRGQQRGRAQDDDHAEVLPQARLAERAARRGRSRRAEPGAIFGRGSRAACISARRRRSRRPTAMIGIAPNSVGQRRRPANDHADRRPEEQVVELAEHDEEHARADLPARDAVAPVQVEAPSRPCPPARSGWR